MALTLEHVRAKLLVARRNKLDATSDIDRTIAMQWLDRYLDQWYALAGKPLAQLLAERAKAAPLVHEGDQA